MFTLRSFLWLLAFTIPFLISHTTAYTIHPNCYAQGKEKDVEAAVGEAFNIAEYAIHRVKNRFPHWNEEIFNAMMPSADSFIGKSPQPLQH